MKKPIAIYILDTVTFDKDKNAVYHATEFPIYTKSDLRVKQKHINKCLASNVQLAPVFRDSASDEIYYEVGASILDTATYKITANYVIHDFADLCEEYYDKINHNESVQYIS